MPGGARRLLAQRLTHAYASGLLSEDTFQTRLDELMGATVLEPGRLIGDLNLRQAGPGRARSLRPLLTSMLAALPAVLGRRRGGPVSLLALDWDGARGELLMGRDPACEVSLSDPTVSRRHALVCFRDGRWILQDLGSRNGTIVNGVRVGRCELRPGDELMLGAQRLLVD
jgi:hypothetical protein